ncbi:MAG: type IV pilin protein [Steroidobacteraceae bacterium]|jgi:type IV pilus assembly protein PilE
MQLTRKSAGFSLIELAVAMVIVAIIAAIAIPSYSNYALQSHRTDAKTALLDLASLEERYYSVNNTYTLTPANLGYTAFPQTVGSGYYQVNVTNVNPPALNTPATYTLTATAIGTQTKDTLCTSFTLNQQGVQTSSDTVNNSCWH